MKIKTKLLSLSSGALLLALAAPSYAAYETGSWNAKLTSSTSNGVELTSRTAWDNSGGSNKLTSIDVRIFGSGIGAGGEDTPYHAVDNKGRKESILFSFDKSIALTKVTMGYIHNDADFSLFRYVGNGIPSLEGKKYNNIESPTGWERVKNYVYGDDTGSGHDYNDTGHGSSVDINTNKTSSHWLIAALNKRDRFYDSFKIASLDGKWAKDMPPTGVPTVGTLPLIALSLIGLSWAARRKV